MFHHPALVELNIRARLIELRPRPAQLAGDTPLRDEDAPGLLLTDPYLPGRRPLPRSL